RPGHRFLPRAPFQNEYAQRDAAERNSKVRVLQVARLHGLSEGFSGGLFGLGKELLKERRSMVGLAEVTVVVVARCQKQRHLAGEWLESFLDLYPLGLG